MRSHSVLRLLITSATLFLLWNALPGLPELEYLHTRQSVIGVAASHTQTNIPSYSGDISPRQTIPFFILVGDTQRTSIWELKIGREQNDSARQLVLNRIAEENPAFLVILGDLVFQGDDSQHWERFDEVAREIRQKNIPVFPLFGNHEYFGIHKKAFDHFFGRFPHLNRQFWYVERFNSVAIVLLDSNFKKISQDLINKQNVWYRSKLNEYENDDAIKTVIVCCHHAPLTNSRVVSDDLKVQEYFVEPFKRSPKAKLFITGHCHSYERFVEDGKEYIVSGGGGGPRQKLRLGDKQRHKDQYNGCPGCAIREFHFCKIVLEQGHLRVQMVKLNEGLSSWSVGDEFVVDQ